MAKKKNRIGVAGLGRIGWNFHCKTLAPHPDFDLVAVQDLDAARRREAEASYGVTSYERFDAMLRDAALDAVAIATPTHLHRAMAEEALERGCHVMLEKPMAAQLEDAEAIVHAAEARGRALTVYQPHRAAAYFQHLCRLIATEKIGPVYHVRRALFNYVRRDDWQSLLQYGGGMLNNYGAHLIDQLLQLIGYDVRRVFCNMRLVASLGDAEDVVKVLIETEKGVLGEADINQASAINPYELEVWGSRGSISLEKGVFHLRYVRAEDLPHKELNAELASANRAYPSDNLPFQEETVPVDPAFQVDVYADFAAAIREGKPPLARPQETLAVMRVMDRCRQDCGRIIQTGIA